MFLYHDVLSGWQYKVGSQPEPGWAYATVWHPLISGGYRLVHKTLLSTTRVGSFKGETSLDIPVHVRKGDVIGYHKPPSGIYSNG